MNGCEHRSRRARAAVSLAWSVALAAGLSSTSGCADEPCPGIRRSQPPELVRSEAAAVALDAVPRAALSASVTSNNAFAVSLFGRLRGDFAEKNLIASPLSASLALGMTYAGAAGQTATEMATALHFDGDVQTVAEGQGALARAIASRQDGALSAAAGHCSPGYGFTLVNSLWGERTYTWNGPFLDTLARDYDTGVAAADFAGAPQRVARTIDDWVAAATNGAIDELLPPDAIDDKTRLVLVNAIYLKLPWATNFDPANTHPGSFERADGSVVSTSFMEITESFGFASDDAATTVALPLSGGQLAVVITVPLEGVGLATYEAALSADSPALTVPGGSVEVHVSIPRIAFKTPGISFKAALEDLGMRSAFDPDLADLTGLCSAPPDHERLHIDDVVQKARFEMKETGVGAVAATEVGVTATSGPPQVVADRPYLVSIVDVPTGAVLFLGHVMDPTDAGAP